MDEVELIGGPEKRAIVIEPYRPTWPAAFQEHRRRIEDALGSVASRVDHIGSTVASRVDHIGSTAVPGLAAKPIIDIQVSVPDVDDNAPYQQPLVAAGYVLRCGRRATGCSEHPSSMSTSMPATPGATGSGATFSCATG